MNGAWSTDRPFDQGWCLETLRLSRWPGGVRCTYCESQRVTKHSSSARSGRQKYRCRSCRRIFTDLSGTVFARSNLPLPTWFRCLHLLGAGLSTAEMAKALNVKWDTALSMRRRLAAALRRSALLQRLRAVEPPGAGGSMGIGKILCVSLKEGKGMAKKMWSGIVVTLLVLFVSSWSAHGADTGTITGNVTYSGNPPQPEKLVVSKDTAKCGTEKLSESLVVGPEQGLRWAVLSLAGADGTPAQAETVPTLDQNGCQFIPHVVVVQAGKELTVLNSDGILHNVHTYSKKNAPMNKAQPGFKKKMKVKFDEAEVVKVACDAHPWMSAWIFVSENPFATATDESGSFELAGVPPGTYELRLWHESLGERTKQITVKAGGETKISFDLAAK